MTLFFSESLLYSALSTGSSFTAEQKVLRELQLSMDGLWIEMMDGDEVGYKAYLAFLDAAQNNFPILDRAIMEKLAHYELAYQYNEDNPIILDPIKLNLWDKYGTLGDNMKPRVKGL